MEEVKNTKRKKKTSMVKHVASGDMFFKGWAKQPRYFLLLFALAVCYISQHYFVEQTVYAAKEMEGELERTRMEYTIRSSELMRWSKHSAVEQELKKRNMTLIAPQRPPKRIKMN